MQIMSNDEFKRQLGWMADIVCDECGNRAEPVIVIAGRALCNGCIQKINQKLEDYIDASRNKS